MIRSILILLTLAAAAGCSSSPAAPPAELVLDGRWVGDYAGGTLELEIPGPVVIDSGADVASGCRDLRGCSWSSLMSWTDGAVRLESSGGSLVAQLYRGALLGTWRGEAITLRRAD